ncbi:MAG: hypothetical protein IKD74_07495 [Clostridia bacterium]|nr:hypothetical protein [Clostridia bacterium]MBR6136525.1 hypothetical protein [Bacilli bacterium]
MLESPRTYRGYNSNNEVVITKQAANANGDLNPAEVKQAIENVKAVFEEQMNGVARALRNISQDADEAIVVEGTKMNDTIEDTAQVLTQIGPQITQGIDTLYELSVDAHNKIQQNYNNMAYNACRVNGVVDIR